MSKSVNIIKHWPWLFVFFLLSAPIYAQVDFDVNAGIEVPVTSGDYTINSGFYSGATVTVAMPFHRNLGALGDISYSGHQFNGTSAVNFIAGQLGVSYRFSIADKFSVIPRLAGGIFYNWSTDLNESGYNPCLSPGVEFELMLSRVFGLNIRGEYRVYFGQPETFFSSALISLGVKVSPWNAKRSANLKIYEPKRDIIFPIYRYYYDSNPFGSVMFENKEKEPISNITVKYFAPDFMREPNSCGFIDTLGPGETVTTDLFALFNEQILEVLEGTKINGNIILEYSFRGTDSIEERSDTYNVAYRNGMKWVDDNSAACFVTAKDPFVLPIGKRISGISTGIEIGSVPENIAKVAGIHAFIANSGIQYVIDPNSPYTTLSGDSNAIDYLQFPVETLNFYGGDCDDLSILYCSFLEGIGVNSAFITVPGHIYIAFDSGISTNAANRLFNSQKSFIDIDGTAWIPLEVTSIGDRFNQAWDTGYQAWAKNPEERGFHDIQNSWQTYPPVQPPFSNENSFFYDSEALPAEISEEIDFFIWSTVESIAGPLIVEIQNNPDDYRLENKLGVIYARFGMYDNAEKIFQDLYDKNRSVSMLINLGNIAFVKGDFHTSSTLYQEAYDSGRQDIRILRGLAESYRKIGNFTESQMLLSKAEKINNGGVETARSSELSYLIGGLEWEEE